MQTPFRINKALKDPFSLNKPKPKAPEKLPDNGFRDIYQILQELRKAVGSNITIAAVLEENGLLLSFSFHKIPKYKDLPMFHAAMEPEDWYEPTASTITVVNDGIKEYLAKAPEHIREARKQNRKK